MDGAGGRITRGKRGYGGDGGDGGDGGVEGEGTEEQKQSYGDGIEIDP